MVQELPTLPEHLSSIFSFICMFCRWLFVVLYFFFWPLCCLFSHIYGFWLRLWYLQEEFENTKGVISIEEQTTQWTKEKVQKDKQPSTKHTYKTKDRVTRTPLRSVCEPGCSSRVSSYKPGDKSWMRKGPDDDYNKWNISVVICNTDILQPSTKSWWRP